MPSWLENFGALPDDITELIEKFDWEKKVGEIAELITSGLGSVADVVSGFLSTIFSSVINFFLSVIFSIYIYPYGKRKAWETI